MRRSLSYLVAEAQLGEVLNFWKCQADVLVSLFLTGYRVSRPTR